MTDFAFVFPGQGSQHVGMGKKLWERYPEVKAFYEQTDEILGYKNSELSFSGRESDLSDTSNAQPAIMVYGLACLKALELHLGTSNRPAIVAGHSVGEYTALVTAGALSLEDAIYLVKERGRLMKAAGQGAQGGMAAIFGGDLVNILLVCNHIESSTGLVLKVANDNCPGQIVLSGHMAALRRFETLSHQCGVSSIRRLNVSVACHTPLMDSAQNELNALIKAAPIQEATIPICANISAGFIQSPAQIRLELETQLCNPVQWKSSLRSMRERGINHFYEISENDSLSGLIRHTLPEVRTENLLALEGFHSITV